MSLSDRTGRGRLIALWVEGWTLLKITTVRYYLLSVVAHDVVHASSTTLLNDKILDSTEKAYAVWRLELKPGASEANDFDIQRSGLTSPI
jgi:hypothetical protein